MGLLVIFFYYMILAFLVVCGIAFVLLMWIAKWLVAFMLALVVFSIEQITGKQIMKTEQPVLPSIKPQAYYSSRR